MDTDITCSTVNTRALIIISMVLMLLVLADHAAATPVTVTITRVTALVKTPDLGLEAFGEGTADLYAVVIIGASSFSSKNVHVDDDPDITPNWTFTQDFSPTPATVPVIIQIFDHDDTSADDLADADPDSGDRSVGLVVDLQSGTWTGDASGNQHCLTGLGPEGVEVCWEICTFTDCDDDDGDGLPNGYETNGLDTDGDGTADFFLDPQHKDLLVELDYRNFQLPSHDDIQAVKAAFAAAPLGNIDGTFGINLWVDTGGAVDLFAFEGSIFESCDDGIDNGGDGDIDGADNDCAFRGTSIEDPPGGTCNNGNDDDNDGLVDGADPDCMVGDNLGGGNQFTGQAGCLDSTFYAIKAANFDPRRARTFRYAISGHPADNTLTGNPNDDDCGGGRGEIGGNDFIEYNHDGGTFMHELGHTLNLRHGGDVNDNCKPNYLSTMNYDLQFGISRTGGGIILDYSPPRTTLSGAFRSTAPLASLDENNLDEETVLDPTDGNNWFAFVDGNGDKVQWPLNSDVDGDGSADGINWSGDDTDPPLESGIPVNLNTADATTVRPEDCAKNTTNEVLNGYHDWGAIVLDFRGFADAADGSVNPETVREPDTTDLELIRRTLNTTNLGIAKSAQPNPVEVGQPLTYQLAIQNRGPNPARKAAVTDTLPAFAPITGLDNRCTESLPGNVACQLVELRARATSTIDVTLDTSGVCVNGLPRSIMNTATVENISPFAGADKDPSDNMAQLTVTPVDTTPPVIDQLSVDPSMLWSPDHSLVPVTVSASATDLCDDMPVCSISGVNSNEDSNDTGDGNTNVDWQIDGPLQASVRAERSGHGSGRIYELTVTCTDASGNAASAITAVTVAKSQR
jgi:uncharacterized repeat protein (TIGR01451 family)